MKKKLHIIVWALGCLMGLSGLAGCQQDDLSPLAEEGKKVNVSLSLGTLSFDGTDTRAMAPHTPEVENLINDIWVLQFNERGILLDTKTKYFPRKGEAGMYVEDFEVELITARNSTVCIVANTNNPNLSWPNNLPTFQQLLIDIKASNDLSKRDRIPMCGYWMGDVREGTKLSALLSRMITRINLVINNETGTELSGLTVSLENVPTEAYVYPRTNQGALPDDAYTTETFSDTFSEGIPADESQQFYYYIAPNICTGSEKATKATITSTSGDKTKTWSVTLGNDSPETSNRNYSLYANNYYTFTLNLK